MLDLQFVRSHPELIRDLCARRMAGVDVDELLSLDREVRSILAQVGELRHHRKGLLGSTDREQARDLKLRISQLEDRLNDVGARRDGLLKLLPNLLAPDTPEGADDTGNLEVSRWGRIPQFDFEVRSHDTLGAQLGILDLRRGAKVAGSGFYYWKGDGARMVWGIFDLALRFLDERGFTPMITPIVASERTLYGTGYLPFFADQIYRVTGDEHLGLIGTSEQTIVGYHDDEMIPASSLPLLYTAFTPCLRTEAGSYGKASRGAFRVHQFHKVEQIVFCRPDDSEEWHQRCLRNEEDFMQLLGIPYRVVRVCLGDLGAPAYKKLDVEGWFAGFGGYRETHSNTNLLDYQTRRLQIRCKGGAIFYPHTISATMITDRAALAIMENNQTTSGEIIVPPVLQPYLGGRDRISPGGR